MPWQSPKLRDLSSWNSRVSDKVFEISTPLRNSLYWSIIISYLIPSEDHGVFSKRLLNLTDDSDESQAVLNEFKNYNSSDERSAFYFGYNMSRVLNKFKRKIDRCIRVQPAGDNMEDLKLAAASEILNCFIEVYHIKSKRIQKSEIFSPKEQPINSDVNKDTIIIFRRAETNLGNGIKDTFGFGAVKVFETPVVFIGASYSHCIGLYIGKDTVRLLLGENNEHEFHKKNFLVSLLKSEAKKAIPIIYASTYMLECLKIAGYKMNPLVKGRDGLSSFYFCIGLPDSECLNILYDYVTNNFNECGESSRKPGDKIVKALSDLKRAFETDFEHSNGFSLLSPTACQRYREILRFNDYQMNVVKIMKDNQQKSADEIVLAIVEEYINYFLSGALPDDEGTQFENYHTFSDYYKKLDSYTCALLLDRLFSIKNDAFSDLVEPLFLMMMSNHHFPRKEHDHDGGTPLDCKGCAHRVIPFKYRMNFLEALKVVFGKVQMGSAGNNASPVDMILKSIQSIPKDDYILGRIKVSLEASIGIEVNDTQSVLTIFRTLQFLGEAFATSITENFVSGFLLSAHIPIDIELALLDIRNDISHYKAHVIPGKLNLETRIDLFKEIQEELKLIYQVLEPVFSCQQFKIKYFIIQSATSLFHISKDELKNIAREREIWCKTQWDQFKSFTLNVFKFFKKVINAEFPKMTDSKKYFQKIKRLQDGAVALNLVFSFKITSDDPMVAKDLADAREKLQKIIKSLEEREPTNHDIKDLHNIFDKYVSLLKQVFSLEANDTKSKVKCENLIHLKENLKHYNIFVGEENSKIRKLISECLERSFEATAKLETALKNSQEIPNIDQVLNDTYLSSKNRKIIKGNFSLKSSENLKILESCSYSSQDKALGEHETSKKLLEMLTKEEYKKVLLQHSSTFGQPLENKFLKLGNQKMEFLIERINLIENILDDQGESFEFHVRLSLEMLLFDCMNVMEKRKDLENICTKIYNLFAGVYLRNILSHGNILIDQLGTLLDSDDLPSELGQKMYELIRDKKCLKTLSDLWMKKKPMNTRELENLINQGDFRHIADIWKKYSAFLPMRQ